MFDQTITILAILAYIHAVRHNTMCGGLFPPAYIIAYTIVIWYQWMDEYTKFSIPKLCNIDHMRMYDIASTTERISCVHIFI